MLNNSTSNKFAAWMWQDRRTSIAQIEYLKKGKTQSVLAQFSLGAVYRVVWRNLPQSKKFQWWAKKIHVFTPIFRKSKKQTKICSYMNTYVWLWIKIFTVMLDKIMILIKRTKDTHIFTNGCIGCVHPWNVPIAWQIQLFNPERLILSSNKFAAWGARVSEIVQFPISGRFQGVWKIYSENKIKQQRFQVFIHDFHPNLMRMYEFVHIHNICSDAWWDHYLSKKDKGYEYLYK